MDNTLLTQIESNLGFSKKKATVFLALLQLGETSIAEIAQKAKLKRTTVYNILPELLDEGLVATTTTQGRKRYFVTDPRIIVKLMETKIETTKSLLPLLMALHSVSVHQPKISLFEGENGARQIYEDTLSISPGNTISGFIGDLQTNPIPEKELALYIKARIDRKIKNKVIVAPSPYAEFLKKNAEKELREVKTFTGTTSIKMPSVDIKIYGNKIAIISYRENFLGVVIESRDISQMCRILFEALWDKS
jgi:sugar-specific transcriptional regulator TrmB